MLQTLQFYVLWKLQKWDVFRLQFFIDWSLLIWFWLPLILNIWAPAGHLTPLKSVCWQYVVVHLMRETLMKGWHVTQGRKAPRGAAFCKWLWPAYPVCSLVPQYSARVDIRLLGQYFFPLRKCKSVILLEVSTKEIAWQSACWF